MAVNPPGGGQIGQLLNAKIAGIPAWVAVVAVIGGVIVVRRLGIFGGSSSSSAQQPANVPNQGVPPGWVPASTVGLPQQPGNPPAPQQVGVVSGIYGPAALYASPGPGIDKGGKVAEWLPPGTLLLVAGPAVTGVPQTIGSQTSNQWVPVTRNGNLRYIWDQDLQLNAPGSLPTSGLGGGRGGGSRSAVLMHHGHPLIKQRVRFPHYHVVGRGGPSTVHAVAHAAGLHPARIMALNPHLRADGYRLRPGQVLRIA